MYALLSIIGLRRIILIAAWLAARELPAQHAVPLVETGVWLFGPIVFGALVFVLVPSLGLWWHAILLFGEGRVSPALTVVAALAVALDILLFAYNWRVHLRSRYGGADAVTRQVRKQYPMLEQPAVLGLLAQYDASRTAAHRGDRFMPLLILDLANGDPAVLRNMIELAQRDSRDVQEWRVSRLWAGIL